MSTRRFNMPTSEPPPREAVLGHLDDLGVLRHDDHIVYAAKDHGPDYFQKNLLLADPFAAAGVAFHLAASFVRDFDQAIIIGPASAGIGLAQIVGDAATRLNPDGMYIVMYADKEGKNPDGTDRFVVKRNTHFLTPAISIIAVEDVVTTGTSLRNMIEAIRTCSGRGVSQARVICNRGVTKEDLGVAELDSFLTLNLPKYSAQDCPLCKTGVPINTELGHGADFVKKHGQPPYVVS